MIALILLCIAVILLSAPGWPSPPSMAALLFALSGCASTLPIVSAGLDASATMLKASCPHDTPACETALTAYNDGVAAYNLAIVADAVGRDADALKAQALAQLDSLLTALESVVAKP